MLMRLHQDKLQLISLQIVIYAPQLNNFRLFCIPDSRHDFSRVGMISVRFSHYFYLLKVIDLLDTVFFILRKRNRQVTFLHIYHHAGMVFAGYIYMKVNSGGGYAIVLGEN
jgi:GNS1/SUR4 family